jgi:hypothetical protein
MCVCVCVFVCMCDLETSTGGPGSAVSLLKKNLTTTVASKKIII